MSKLTVEQLKEKCIDDLKTAYRGLFLGGLGLGYVPEDMDMSSLQEYQEQVTNALEELGEDTNLLSYWLAEALNDLRLGDVLLEYIKEETED